jgi:hypothetical protein
MAMRPHRCRPRSPVPASRPWRAGWRDPRSAVRGSADRRQHGLQLRDLRGAPLSVLRGRGEGLVTGLAAPADRPHSAPRSLGTETIPMQQRARRAWLRPQGARSACGSTLPRSAAGACGRWVQGAPPVTPGSRRVLVSIGAAPRRRRCFPGRHRCPPGRRADGTGAGDRLDDDIGDGAANHRAEGELRIVDIAADGHGQVDDPLGCRSAVRYPASGAARMALSLSTGSPSSICEMMMRLSPVETGPQRRSAGRRTERAAVDGVTGVGAGVGRHGGDVHAAELSSVASRWSLSGVPGPR